MRVDRRAACYSDLIDGVVVVVLNFARDRIALDAAFLSTYQNADDETLAKWEGWIAVSARVAMRVGPTCIEFKCASGSSHFIWRSEVDSRLPSLHSWPPGDDCSCIVRLKADGDLQLADVVDEPEPPAPSPLDRLSGLVTLDQIARALGCTAETVGNRMRKDVNAPRSREVVDRQRYFDAGEIREWLNR